jgi:hypothetical protein
MIDPARENDGAEEVAGVVVDGLVQVFKECLDVLALPRVLPLIHGHGESLVGENGCDSLVLEPELRRGHP